MPNVVYVVYNAIGPLAVHVKPSKATGFIVFLADMDVAVTRSIN